MPDTGLSPDALTEAQLRARLETPRLSVIITNFNYADFIATAIDSVLSQHPRAELIVVDDLSTDSSRDVIRSYGDQVIPVFQETNQGQGAGFNAGFERATGDLVMFLDADDFLLPGAVREILSNYVPGVAIYHYRMRYANAEGELGRMHPSPQTPLAEGDLSAQLRDQGRYVGTITSGLVFSRKVLEKVLPMDAGTFRQNADGYLTSCVPLYGPARTSQFVISGYRVHNRQMTNAGGAYARRARWRLAHDEARYAVIREHAGRLGLPVADHLGDRDYLDLEERLISLTFEPEFHPIGSDTAGDLIHRIVSAVPETASGRNATVKSLFWRTMGVLPPKARRLMLQWRIDPQARPPAVAFAARQIRRFAMRRSH